MQLILKNNIKKKFTTQKLFLFISAIACLISIVSCADEPYRLDARDKLIVDTTANRQMEQFAKEIDMQCKQNFDTQVKKLTDSIVQYQIKAIDEKLQIKPEK